MPDEELEGSQYQASDPEAEDSSGEPEVSSSDEQDNAAPRCPTLTGTCRKLKKDKRSKKRCKANPPDNDVDDADIEMVGLDDGPLEVDDDPIKDIKHFFSDSYTKDGQKFRDCRLCP